MIDCIEWTGSKFFTHGNWYGFLKGKKFILAHRDAYEKAYGGIPAGLVLDHLCRNSLCINVDHLEAISNVENIMRGEGAPAKNSRKTHCKRGHEFTSENTHMSPQGRRICKACRLWYDRNVR